LDNDRALLIKGLAGQGKSTLLRKLLSNNAKRFNRLPIFYELKNYNGGSIEAAISHSLSNSGVNIGEYALKKLLSDSNVKVYLDAFDETKPEYRNELLDEIRRLVNAFNCHVVCTSRPDTEIDALSELETYTVCELTEVQIFGIINKTASDLEKANELCEALKRSPLHTSHDSILKSPILVVLFCISYNLGEEIPSTLSQFYSNIFDTVFHRHDNIKGKVHRARHWNDNRRIYRELFNCLCFISLRAGFNSFKKNKFVEFISVSLNHVDEDDSLSDKVAIELSSITNLIIEDGFNEYRYVHKSIQEFFASSFVMSLKHDKKIAFYKKCFSDHTFHSLFSNTLFFLEELDYYDYNEYGFIPSVCDMYSLPNNRKINEIIIPKAICDLFLDRVSMKAKITVFKNNKSESFDLEINNFMFEDAAIYPEIYSINFNFAMDFIKVEFSNKELAKLMLDSGSKLEDGWHKLSLRSVLKQKNIPESVALEALGMGFDVLIRRKFDAAVEKLMNRSESLDKAGYFDF
ncbi:NACHT domain-containing protein, partial [Aliivibrio logei]|uniref:NACHT domain-containing protein n=1 Tax=Aliivibrio logei TaxID=688 RepID=UPI0003C7C802